VADILRYERWWPLDDITISRAHGDGRTVEAYAAVFNHPYEVKDKHGHYMEVVERSAFNKTLKDGGLARVMCLYNHGLTVHGTPSDAYSVPIGTPLEITPDAKGLKTVTRYNQGQEVDRILDAINNGAIRSQSFRGRIVRSSPHRVPGRSRTGDLPTVTRNELGLTDYGPTPVPVNAAADIIAVRSVQDLAAALTNLDAEAREELARAINPTLQLEPELVDAIMRLDPEQRADLTQAVRHLPSTTPPEPETETATSTTDAGTEEPPHRHSGRIQIARAHMRMELLAEGVM
jgi:HK97 family phage prohead protease